MRPANTALILVAWSCFPLSKAFSLPGPFLDTIGQRISALTQRPMDNNAPGIQLPPTPEQPAQPSGDVILSDVMGSQRSINIFSGFTRDIDSVSKRLDTSGENTTVLAPLNSAISSLPRKPWEDPKDYDRLGASAYEGEAGESRAHANLRRFTQAHIVPCSPWSEGEKVETMLGSKIWWEQKDGRSYIQPGNVEVEKVASNVANGQIWVVKGVLNYAS